MVNPPFASPVNFISVGTSPPQNEKEGFWCIFQDKGLILTIDEGKQILTVPPALKRSLYVGKLNDRHIFAGEVEEQDQVPPGCAWSSLRSLFGVLNDEHYAIAGRAMQLIEWDRTHKYCGRCGSLTFSSEKERCRECVNCEHLFFPKLAPVIMALVKKENKFLLARGSNFPEKFYSIIAGFVDPGETLEQCVIREVFEEVGLTVKNVCYFGSQPWPFSQSLIIGFTCEWQKGNIQIDSNEIIDADWFDITNLPQLPPSLSLARIMIDRHIQNR